MTLFFIVLAWVVIQFAETVLPLSEMLEALVLKV